MTLKRRVLAMAVGGILIWLAAGCAGSPPPSTPPGAPPEQKPPEQKPPEQMPTAKPAEAPAPVRPATEPGQDVIEICQSREVVLAYLEVEGKPYAHMGDEIDRARRLLAEQGIRPMGFSRTIYLEDPRAIDSQSCRYRVAFPVSRIAAPREPLRRLALPPQLFARALHNGDYDEAFRARYYEQIPRLLESTGYTIQGPIIEIYRYPLVEHNPKNWVTELWYPVQPKNEKKKKGG